LEIAQAGVRPVSNEQHVLVWLTAAEAADRARLCPEVFRRKVRRGEGPPSFGTGRLRRFKASSVDEWIERGSGASSTPADHGVKGEPQ
jgi:excisionase family DNA binding protein